MRVFLVVLAASVVLIACPQQHAAGEGEGESSEGEGEGGAVCFPACTEAGTGCANDNCGLPQCVVIVSDEGGACKVDSARCPQGGVAPCANGRECTSIGGADATCVTPGQAAAPCDPAETDLTRDGCADGFRCLSQEAVCGPACGAGGACPGTDECVDNVCFPQSPLGGPCPIEATTDATAGDGDGCAAGLRCGFDANNNGPQCIQDECTTDSDCAGPNGACNFPGCSPAERTCATLVGEGGSCFAGCLNGGCANFTLSCAAGLECEHFLNTCAGGDGSLGTCVVPGGQGASCSVTHDAAIDGCQAGLGCDQTTSTCL